MKKFLKILGIVIGAIIVIYLVIVFLLSRLDSATNKNVDAMFSNVRAGNIQEAYTDTAKAFQAAVTLDQFKTYLEQYKLSSIESTKRNKKNLDATSNEVELIWSATTTSGETIALDIFLSKEDGQWKVLHINLPDAKLVNQTTTASTGTIPTQTEITTMVQKAMGLISNAINTANFTTFYANIAHIRQQQTTATDLQKIFQIFIDKKIDLSFTTTLEPNYTATPTIDENGILIIQGTFTTQDTSIAFRQKFYQENNEWKLFGINIQM